ncbi:hypothetical protein EB354_02620 [Chryseobacterium balustinum]|nr:hypothetical protein EB354_02620 [Chryseobacterium balustinum]
MVGVAKKVFSVMIISSFITIVVIPYNAALNAREELWFFSISETIVSLLKLCAAIYLLYTTSDLLLTYTILMLFAIGMGGLINYVWCVWRYPECRIKLKGNIDKYLFKEMFAFAGWNTLGSLTMIVRNQGIALILNVFFGVLLNAAYGIANQVNALVITFAGTLTTVFTPMIVKAKGEGNDEKMLFISIFSSKMTFYLSSVIAIPVLVFTPLILDIWLNKAPEYSVEFCRVIIVAFLIMQLYPGITRALYAEGNIKWYQIVISILLVAILPIGYLLYYLELPPISIFIVLVIAQFLTLITTVHFAGKKVGLNIKEFYTSSIIYPCILYIVILSILMIIKNYIFIDNQNLNLIVNTFIFVSLYSVLYFYFIFNHEEKKILKGIYNSLISKIKRK